MLLQKDPVYWGNVTADLGFYMKNLPADAELRRVLKTVRRDWAATEAGTSSLFRMEMSDSKSGHKSVVSDADLATSWLYGDLVHADEEARAIGDGYDIWQRYEAAVHQTARLAVLTLATLKLVLVAEAEGLFQLSPSVLEADVIVKELVREHANVQVFLAPEDTDMPEEFTELGPEWTRLEPGRSPA